MKEEIMRFWYAFASFIGQVFFAGLAVFAGSLALLATGWLIAAAFYIVLPWFRMFQP